MTTQAKKARKLEAVTPLGTLRKTTRIDYRFCGVARTDTSLGRPNSPDVYDYWSRTAAGAEKLARQNVGYNGIQFVGVYPATETTE